MTTWEYDFDLVESGSAYTESDDDVFLSFHIWRHFTVAAGIQNDLEEIVRQVSYAYDGRLIVDDIDMTSIESFKLSYSINRCWGSNDDTILCFIEWLRDEQGILFDFTQRQCDILNDNFKEYSDDDDFILELSPS